MKDGIMRHIERVCADRMRRKLYSSEVKGTSERGRQRVKKKKEKEREGIR